MSFVKTLKNFFSRDKKGSKSASEVQPEPPAKIEKTTKEDVASPVEISEEIKTPTSLEQVPVPPPLANQPEIIPPIKNLESTLEDSKLVSRILPEQLAKMKKTNKEDVANPVEKSEEMKEPTSLEQVPAPPPLANQPGIVPTTNLDTSKLPTPGEEKPEKLTVLPLHPAKKQRFFNWKKAAFWVGVTAAFSSVILGVALGMIVNGHFMLLIIIFMIIIKLLSPFTNDQDIARPWYY